MAAGGTDGSVAIEHPFLGTLELVADAGPDGAAPEVLFCENETNTSRLFGGEPITPYPKDGINDHVVHGAPTVNPGRTGTKCSFWYKLTVEPGSTAQLRLRLRPAGTTAATRPFGKNFSDVLTTRESEADEFYQELTPRTASDDEAMVMRQAFAGMLWSKQLFYYDVKRWLDGDPSQPTPPAERQNGRNAKWRNFNALTLDKVAADLSDRLISIFTDDPDGRRPCFGGTELMQRDPAWHDNLIFSEYFHGDNGAAIGAFHQTGWTGVIADLIRRRHGEVDSVGDVVRRLDAANREPREP